MRNIKFKCWFEREKRWLKDEEFKIAPDGHVVTYGIYTNQEGLKLVISTGLEDKQGKEIYEGDILCFTGLPIGHQKPFAVRWNTMTDFGDWSPKEEAEVIGNIYENQELIPA
jgi:hypothetical protein